MNTDQNTRHIYEHKRYRLGRSEGRRYRQETTGSGGNMELLLQGKETGIVPLKLHISVLSLTMDATLKLVPDVTTADRLWK